MQRFIKWLQDGWYEEMYLSPLLAPFSLFYLDAVRLRRFLYRKGLLRSHALGVPVVIVGNISVGGTGKTPLVLWLVELLHKQGYRPGIVSRGYAGQATRDEVIDVQADTPVEQVGDEPLLMAKRGICPVVVGRNRVAAGKFIIEHYSCDIVVADDGLQHYALKRDLEIAVIDGQRRFGNGYCLPAGPLREPVERLNDVDLIIVNGGEVQEENEYSMSYRRRDAVNLKTGETVPLINFASQPCRAITAIGNPKQFFDGLRDLGLQISSRAFPDHHFFTADEACFDDLQPVLMTEKDAVKCHAFANERHWYVPIDAQPEPAFTEKLLQLLENKQHG